MHEPEMGPVIHQLKVIMIFCINFYRNRIFKSFCHGPAEIIRFVMFIHELADVQLFKNLLA